MELKEMTAEQLLEQRSALKDQVDVEGADLDQIEADVRAINEELEARKAAEAEKAEVRAAVAAGEGEVIKEINKVSEERKMYGVESVEYRDAWVKSLIHRELNEEERAALSSAGAVIPTMTVNAVWDRLIKKADLLAKVDVSQFPTYVRFPVATTVNAAASGVVGTTITESSDVVDYVDLVPNDYVKLLTVGADIEHMAIPAVHDWIVNNLTDSIAYAINKDILVGSGTNALKGIKESVNASGTAIPATVTKASILKIMASLGSRYQDGAIWIMTPEMFYEKIIALQDFEAYTINDGFQFKLFGHDVVLMSEALISSKETIFYGDPKAYKVNIFKPIEVKPFESPTTTNFQFRGACMADGELLDTSAFVRFAQT